MSKNIDVCHQSNPFHMTTTSLLVEILADRLDLIELAAKELSNRCRDTRGEYVGMKDSATAYDAFMAARRRPRRKVA